LKRFSKEKKQSFQRKKSRVFKGKKAEFSKEKKQSFQRKKSRVFKGE